MQGITAFYHVIYNVRNTLIEWQKELHDITKIMKWCKNNMQDKKLILKHFLSVTSKEHVLLEKSESNEKHNNEALVDGNACEKYSAPKST